MATADDMALRAPGALGATNVFGFPQNQVTRNLMLAVGAAIVLAIMVGLWLWGQQPDYRVLFSNFTDKDGGAIVASLQQSNIPYKYSEGGSAILVPANQVHDARLKLAAQGLPKGGNVGFELMENQKMGVSQFLEQVNFQRALEGELARSIQSISAVQTARVHLAIPKASVFVREQQKPTASVLLNLYPGRNLDQQQVNAIVHLIASSVPELSSHSVTVVDQNGTLLSDPSKQLAGNTLDPSQLKYVQDFQHNIVKRIESIISPMVGSANIRAEATADIDFSKSEQAAETYKPNSPPEVSSIRSQQSSESYNKTAGALGVPGALTNQPQAPATAPIVSSATPTAASSAATSGGTSNSGLMQKDSTVNYEVDKTIRYTQLPMGGVKRLSVAVVINYKNDTDKNGKVSSKPLTDLEKTQITDLIKEAMGYSKERGDTLNVVNSPFASPEKETLAETPFWKEPDTVLTAKEIGKYLLIAAILAYLFFTYLRPMLYKMMGKDANGVDLPDPVAIARRAAAEEEAAIVSLTAREGMSKELNGAYEINMAMAKQLAISDPKVVANVIKTWVSGDS